MPPWWKRLHNITKKIPENILIFPELILYLHNMKEIPVVEFIGTGLIQTQENQKE